MRLISFPRKNENLKSFCIVSTTNKDYIAAGNYSKCKKTMRIGDPTGRPTGSIKTIRFWQKSTAPKLYLHQCMTRTWWLETPIQGRADCGSNIKIFTITLNNHLPLTYTLNNNEAKLHYCSNLRKTLSKISPRPQDKPQPARKRSQRLEQEMRFSFRQIALTTAIICSGNKGPQSISEHPHLKKAILFFGVSGALHNNRSSSD